MGEANSPVRRESWRRALVHVLVASSLALFFVRIWRFIDRTAVDLPYWDQWDFLAPFFDGDSLWAAFRHQHAPVRQGLGALVFALTNYLFDWNMRATSFAIALILLLGAAIALELKVALFGRLTAWDAMIPPLFFRFGQYEALTFIPNPSHGVIPVVLALLACRSLLIENGWARLAALTAISFLASHTGFGFFLPPMLISVLLLRGIYEWRNRARAAMSFLTATAVGVAAATMLVGFRFEELRAVPCRFGSPTVTDHVIWVITMVKASFGFLGRDELAIAGATLVYLIPAASALAVSVTRIARTVPDSDDEREFSLAATPAVLICVSVAFCLSSAWARLCLGPVQALDSRYVTLMIPFAIGLYFSIIRWDVERGMSGATSARKVVRLALLAVLMVSSVHGGFHIAQSDRAGVERSRETKRAWVACARAGGTVAECDFRSQLKVHPVPSATRLDEKLEFLRERRLSFFRPEYE